MNPVTITDIEAWLEPHIDTSCLLWPRSVDTKGHPRTSFEGRSYSVHRLLWEYHRESIPPNHFILRTCGNNLCCNLDHMQVLPLSGRPRKKEPFCPRSHREGMSVGMCVECQRRYDKMKAAARKESRKAARRNRKIGAESIYDEPS